MWTALVDSQPQLAPDRTDSGLCLEVKAVRLAGAFLTLTLTLGLDRTLTRLDRTTGLDWTIPALLLYCFPFR